MTRVVQAKHGALGERDAGGALLRVGPEPDDIVDPEGSAVVQREYWVRFLQSRACSLRLDVSNRLCQESSAGFAAEEMGLRKADRGRHPDEN